MKLVEKLPRCLRRRYLMPDHFRQRRITAQPLKVFQIFPTGSIQENEAFHKRRFVVATLPLLDPNVAPHTVRQPESPKSLRNQRESSKGGQLLFQRGTIQFERQRKFCRRGLLQS